MQPKIDPLEFDQLSVIDKILVYCDIVPDKNCPDYPYYVVRSGLIRRETIWKRGDKWVDARGKIIETKQNEN